METSSAIPAQAGTHREAGWMFVVWHRLRQAFFQGLCLADPWVPAFVGMTAEAVILAGPMLEKN
jgi:hypothetical protein